MERGPEFHVWSIHSKHSFTLLMHQTSIHVQCSLGSKFPSYVLFILSSQNAVRFQLWPSSQSTDCTCSLRVSVWLTPQCWICLRSCSQHSSWRNYSLPAPSSCRLPSFLLTPVQYWSEMHCIIQVELVVYPTTCLQNHYINTSSFLCFTHSQLLVFLSCIHVSPAVGSLVPRGGGGGGGGGGGPGYCGSL